MLDWSAVAILLLDANELLFLGVAAAWFPILGIAGEPKASAHTHLPAITRES